MPELKADVVVLGAGMVGVGAALHLQQRGRDVMLVDQHNAAGEETSYGNAGLIECASVFPYMFPRDFGQLLKYALNRVPNVRYRFVDLPEFLPWRWMLGFIGAAGGQLGGLLVLLIGALLLGMGFIGVYRIARGLGCPMWLRVLLLLLLFIPLVGLLVLASLNARATRRLRDAGYQVGLLGARNY